MGRIELRDKEGLFLTELSNEFFLKYLEGDKERKKIIDNLADQIKHRLDELECQEDKDKEIWHYIFEESIKAIAKEGIGPLLNQRLSENEFGSVFREMMCMIYSSQDFWEYDLAQKLTYNLYRR